MKRTDCQTVTRSFSAAEGARSFGRKCAEVGYSSSAASILVSQEIVGWDTYAPGYQNYLRTLAEETCQHYLTIRLRWAAKALGQTATLALLQELFSPPSA